MKYYTRYNIDTLKNSLVYNINIVIVNEASYNFPNKNIIKKGIMDKEV
jgi:hypothetical protein